MKNYQDLTPEELKELNEKNATDVYVIKEFIYNTTRYHTGIYKYGTLPIKFRDNTDFVLGANKVKVTTSLLHNPDVKQITVLDKDTKPLLKQEIKLEVLPEKENVLPKEIVEQIQVQEENKSRKKKVVEG